MATRFIHCPKCEKEYYPSDSRPFQIQCTRCKTIITSSTGQDACSYDYTNYLSGWRSIPEQRAEDPFGEKRSNSALIILSVIVILFITVVIVATHFAPDSTENSTVASTPANETLLADTTTRNVVATNSNQAATPMVQTGGVTEPINTSSIYSGQCTYYKKELNGTSMTLKPVSSGFAKVVINRTNKKLYFYYDGKLVFQYFGYNSYSDDQQGGEGFTFESDADAHRYIAERVFILNTEMVMGGQLGYQYEITDYKEN